MDKKIYLFLILFLVFINLISSLELGLSPASINLKSKSGEKVCANFSLNSNREVTLNTKDRWTNKIGSRNLNDYQLSKEDFNIDIFSSKEIIVDGREKTEICLVGNRPGNFYGAILFESENGYASVGTWINLNVKKESSFFTITGNVIGNLVDSGNLKFLVLALIPELIILFLLVKKLKKRREKLV